MRVVITGMGVISPLGLNVPTMWENLVAGRSGIAPITLFDTSNYDVHIAGEARGFDPLNYLSAKEARHTDRFIQFALAALMEVLAQSRFVVDKYNAYEVGCFIGSGMGGIWTFTEELKVLDKKGPRRVDPFLIPSTTVDVPSVQIALKTGAQGPNMGLVSACATSADALGHAFETIRHGHASAMFSGGFEAAVTPIGVAAFDRMGALSHRNDAPEKASRPFDATRDGFVIAEGGALLLLEERDFALRRGAEPLAEIVSYAATSDAVHMAAPDAQGNGAAHSIAQAIARAGIVPEEISYINAHGTSSLIGDPAETKAIKNALGEYAYQVPISSTKSMTGHMLGGVGAAEAVICVQALRTGLIPPTINLNRPDPACDLDYVPHRSRKADLRVVVSNSIGFGGHNSTLIFRACK
jgi:beta-ketoacyl-acyl-carrier-protein synthase II